MHRKNPANQKKKRQSALARQATPRQGQPGQAHTRLLVVANQPTSQPTASRVQRAETKVQSKGAFIHGRHTCLCLFGRYLVYKGDANGWIEWVCGLCSQRPHLSLLRAGGGSGTRVESLGKHTPAKSNNAVATLAWKGCWLSLVLLSRSSAVSRARFGQQSATRCVVLQVLQLALVHTV